MTGRDTRALGEAQKAVKTANPNCSVHSFAADITDPASVKNLFDTLPFIPDVLVNNAGISMAQESIVDSDVDKWWGDWVGTLLPEPCCRPIHGTMFGSL